MAAAQKIWLAVSVVVAAVSASTLAKADDKVVIVPVPDWVVVATPPRIKQEVDSAIDIRLMNVQSRIDDSGLHQYFHQIVRVMTPEGLPLLGNFGVAWQPKISSARVHMLKIHRGTLTIDLLGTGGAFQVLRREANLERMQIDGTMTAVMPVADLRVGDELELAWTLDQQNPVLGGLNESQQVFGAGPTFDAFYLRYSWPKTRQVKWAAGMSLPKPVVIDAASDRGFVIDRQQFTVPPVPDGAPARFQRDGIVEVSEFNDWRAVVNTMLPLYEKAIQVAAASPVATEIARIAALSNDPKMRASEALKSVQGNIRYFARTDGLGGYLPESAESVWVARSGDCKGKTTLLVALLRGLGFLADPALVSTGRGDGLDTRLPMPSQFDHVIVRAVVDGKTYWLDGTRLGDRAIETLAVPGFRWALPIRAGSHALEPMIATDPPLTESEWSLELDARGGVDQPAKVHGTAIFRGESASALRTSMSFVPAASRDVVLRKMWLDRHYWIKAEKMTSVYDEQTGEMRLDMTGTGDMDWNNKDGETYNNYEADRATMGQNLVWKRPEAQQNLAPIYVSPRFDVMHETILLPEGGKGFRLEADPVDTTIGGVHYKRTQSLVGERFTITVVTRSREGELTYSEAVAADKATDALAKKRVFIYLPTQVSAVVDRPLYNRRDPVDVAALRGRAARAELVSGSIDDGDYPPEAAKAGASGTTSVTFDIGVDGRAHDCGIGTSSGSVALDNKSCALITERFVYKPARGADGAPTRETRSQRITWRLPAGDAPWVGPYEVTYRYTLGTDGIARDCEISATPKQSAPTAEQCAKAGNNVAVKDESGNPIAVRVVEHHTRTVEPVKGSAPPVPSSDNPR